LSINEISRHKSTERFDEVRRYVALAKRHKRLFSGESLDQRWRGVLKECRINYELLGTGVVIAGGPGFDPLGFPYENKTSLSKVVLGTIRQLVAMLAWFSRNWPAPAPMSLRSESRIER
jgi:hypothetical protein